MCLRALAVLLVAGVLVAKPSAAASASAAGTEKSDEAQPRSRRIQFEVGWDQGPTYELGLRPSAPLSIDQTGWLEHVLLRGRVGGSLDLDGGALAGTAIRDQGLKGAVRRARLLTRGELHLGWDTQYKFEFSFEKSSFFLNDFYLLWHLPRWADTLKVGYFDPPISMQSLASSSGRPLMEVSAPVAALAPGYRSGVQVAGHVDRPSLAWALDLSSVGQTQPLGSSSSSALLAAGRLVWRPAFAEGSGTSDLLHLGLSLSYEFSGSADLRYRARPESFLAPYLLDTGKFEGSSGNLGLEAAWRRGPLTLQGELLESFVEPQSGGTVVFSGVYAQASWMLTGEVRPYDARQGVFQPIRPRHPFAPLRGGWGALDVSGRVSWLDLSDGDVRGGGMIAVAVGPAWTWNRWVRVLVGYVFAHTTGRPDAGDAHIFQARLELGF